MSKASLQRVSLKLRNIVHIKEWGEIRGIARACQVAHDSSLGSGEEPGKNIWHVSQWEVG